MVRGRKRDLSTARKVEAEVSASIHNRFDVEVIDARTGEVRQRAQAENVICGQLWTRLLSGNTYFNFIHYGTGAGTPSSADTALFHFLGYGQFISTTQSMDLPRCAYALRRQIRLSEVEVVGETLTEVGIAYGTAAGSLCTHAMLQDMNGNQISIQKTDTDIINIYATVFVHWPTSLYSGGIQIDSSIDSARTSNQGGLLSYLAGGGPNACQPMYAQLASGRLIGASAFPVSEQRQGRSSYTAAVRTADPAAKTITFTYGRFPITEGNWEFGAYGVTLFCGLSGRNLPYSIDYPAFWLDASGDWFPGTVVSGEAVGTGDGETTDFATAFDLPTNATVYVDGVAAPEVTVESKPLSSDSVGRYFQGVVIEDGVAYPAHGPVSDSGTALVLYPGTYYNPYWRYGLRAFRYYVYDGTLEASDDLINWTEIRLAGNEAAVPEELRNSKYFRFSGASSTYYIDPKAGAGFTGKNIHFPTPPPAGAVITADYTTKCIAKDANHVFDLTVTIHLGEYQA